VKEHSVIGPFEVPLNVISAKAQKRGQTDVEARIGFLPDINNKSQTNKTLYANCAILTGVS